MRNHRQWLAALVPALAVGCVAQGQGSHLMRFADVHQDKVVFTYEGDLWLASTDGGDAWRITSDPGMEVWAKFSPDGKRLAFTAQYDGGMDVYVMDARGGVPARLTYHPAMDRVLGWFPDGEHVLFRSSREYPSRTEMIYKVSINGGMPVKLPVDRAGLTACHPTAGASPTTASAAKAEPGSDTKAAPPKTCGSAAWRRKTTSRSPTGRAVTTSPCGAATPSTSTPTASTAH